MTYCQRCGSQNSQLGTLDDKSPEFLLQLEREISQTQLRLNDLREQRISWKKRTNARLSPLLRLPTELLRHISMAAFPPGIDVNRWGEDTPLLLGSICTAWRSIAWAMPQLWSTVWVKVGRRYHISTAQILDDWLIRSQDFPISLRMNLGYPDEDSYDLDLQTDIMWTIVDCVTRHAERWQDVHLDIPYFIGDSTDCHVPSTFPQLQRLVMLAKHYPHHDWNLDMFEHAPMLTDISLNMKFQEYIFPINTISHLSLSDLTPHEVMRLLRRHPNLTHCVFAHVSTTFGNHPYTEAEALNLQSLVIGSENEFNLIDDFFTKLSAPCLQDLTIQMKPRNYSHEYGRLLSIIRYSSTLVRLCLFRIPIRDPDLVECLSLLPHLRELKLAQMDFGKQVLQQLTIHEDQKPPFLLPHLVDLFFIPEHRNLPINFMGFAQMAQSRRLEPTPERQVAQMKSLSIHVLDFKVKEKNMFDDGSKLVPFKHLKEGGMEIDFRMLRRLQYGSFILDYHERW